MVISFARLVQSAVAQVVTGLQRIPMPTSPSFVAAPRESATRDLISPVTRPFNTGLFRSRGANKEDGDDTPPSGSSGSGGKKPPWWAFIGALAAAGCRFDASGLATDIDDDGVLEPGDNCPTPNPDQADNDHDAIGDVCDEDLDNDGFLNDEDRCPTDVPLNPGEDQIDTDNDGRGDFCDDDDDNDGILDPDDNCQIVAGADTTDTDDDGLGDICDEDRDGDLVSNDEDNCPDIANDQVNSDFDLEGNACDEDDDNDGWLDEDDNCPLIFNDQFDLDGDDLGDLCDDDWDGDSVANTEDNCAFSFNPGQTDIDVDGIGDACDIDIDGDGALNDDDNCPTLSNDQTDSDLDGIGDACDYAPNPLVPAEGLVLAPTRAFLSWEDGTIPEGTTIEFYVVCWTTGGLGMIEDEGACPNAVSTTNRFHVIDLLEGGATYLWKVLTCYDGLGPPCPAFSMIQSFSTDDSLIAWYRLEGDLLDSSGNGHDGTTTPGGMPLFVSGGEACGEIVVSGVVEGAAACLDGVDDFITIPDADPLDSPQTIEIRLNQADLLGNRAFVDKYDPADPATGYFLSYARAADQIDWTVNGGSLGFPVGIEAQVWRDLAVTHQAGEQGIYVGAVLEGLSSGPDLIGANGIDLVIGANVNGGIAYEFFRGLIDEVALYSRVLPPEVLLNNYCAREALSGISPLPDLCQ